MDGYELAARIRQMSRPAARPDCMTANSLEDESSRASGRHDDYVTKPLKLATLRALLGRWLGPRRDRQPPPWRRARARRHVPEQPCAGPTMECSRVASATTRRSCVTVSRVRTSAGIAAETVEAAVAAREPTRAAAAAHGSGLGATIGAGDWATCARTWKQRNSGDAAALATVLVLSARGGRRGDLIDAHLCAPPSDRTGPMAPPAPLAAPAPIRHEVSP